MRNEDTHTGSGLVMHNFYSQGTSRDNWAGGYIQPGGLDGSAGTGIAFCVEAGPASSVTWASTSVIEGANSTRMAAVLAKHEAEDTPDARGQLAYLAHAYLDPGTVVTNGLNQRVRWLQVFTSQYPAQAAAAEAWWAEAAAFEGPFTANTDMYVAPGQQSGHIGNVGVTGGNGSWLAGQPFTLTLTGPAVFDATGTSMIAGTTGTTPAEYAFTSTGNGDLLASINVTGLPANHVLSYKDAEYQRMMIQAAPTAAQGASTPHAVIRDFQPEVTTRVASTFVNKGDALVDQVTAAAAAGSQWLMDQAAGAYVPVLATGTLYGPFAAQPAQSATVPAGAPVAGTETLTFNGPETLSSPGTITASAAGYYTWVWEIKKSAQAPAVQPLIRGDFTDAFGRILETSIVPFQPKISTQVGSRLVAPGDPFIDQVTVAPAAGDLWLTQADGSPVALTARGTLYGPFTSQPVESATVPAGAPVVGTETLAFTSSGTQNTSGDLTATGSGYYTWVWEIIKASQPATSQPYIAGNFTDKFGQVVETSVVPFQPAVATERDSREIIAGQGLLDHVTSSVKAGDAWLTTADGQPVRVTARGTAYGPFTQPLAQGSAIPAGAPVAGTESLVFDGAKTLTTSGSVKATTPGFYTWVWSITKADQPAEFADYIAGDFTDDFMIELETSTLKSVITHSSLVREYNVVPGGRAFDTITITGLPANHTLFTGLGGWAADGATADVTVYGPLAEEPSTTEVPAGTPILTTTKIPAENGVFNVGYTNADKVVATEQGFYVFVYSFAGDDRVAAFTSPFDDVLERFYVPGAATLPVQVVTQAKPAALIDEPFFDTALVTGNVTPGSYLVFEAFGPQDEGQAPVCTEPFFTSQNIPVNAAGYYNSGVTSVATQGNVYWVESLYSPSGALLNRGECGIEAETTVVTEVPEGATVVTRATPAVELGTPARDTAIVTGDIAEGTVLSFEAFLQDGNQAVCTTPIFTTEYGVIDGAGTYESAETVFTAPGTYFWVETLTGPDGVVTHRGECGALGETTVVTKVPVEVAVSTSATPEVELGQSARDIAVVTGLVPEGTVLSFDAFLQDGNQAVCTTPVFSTSNGVIDGAGTYESAETVFTVPGTYFWVETLTGPDGVVLHKGICGAPGETTIVKPAPVTPGLSGGTGSAGGTLPVTGAQGPGLAVTGAQATGLAGAAGLLLALGAGMFTVARRRRGAGDVG